MSHSQPNGRPIHAECNRLDDAGKACTCDEAWDYWDGTTEALDLAIAVAMRQETRKRPAQIGRGPDDDEKSAPDNKPVLSTGDYMGGFWSHAQDLKCKRGDPMRPLVYAIGYNWKRAQAEDEKWERSTSAP